MSDRPAQIRLAGLCALLLLICGVALLAGRPEVAAGRSTSPYRASRFLPLVPARTGPLPLAAPRRPGRQPLPSPPINPNEKETTPVPPLLPGAVQQQVVVPALGLSDPRAEAEHAPEPDAKLDTIRDEGFHPPDDGIAAGPKHLVAVANSLLQVRGSDGREISTVPLKQFFRDEPTRFLFDPRVLFDAETGRFYICCVGRRDAAPRNTTLSVAVSATSDPTGAWHRYTFPAGRGGNSVQEWADFPTLGYDGRTIYVGMNMVAFSTGLPVGNRLFLLDKGRAMAGAALEPFVLEDLFLPSPPFVPGAPAFTLLPCQGAEPDGPGYVVARGGLIGIAVYRIRDPLGEIRVDSLFVDTTDFAEPADGSQRGSTKKLDTGDSRLQSCVYRNGELWTCHTVSATGSAGGRAAVVTYRLDPTGEGTLVDTDTLQDSRLSCYYPSWMPDENGNAIVVYQGSDAFTFPSIYYARYDGSTGTFSAPALLDSGGTHYLAPESAPESRWGDYTSTALDPRTRRRVWIQGELPTTPTHWKKRAARIQSSPLLGKLSLSTLRLDFGVVRRGETASAVFQIQNAAGDLLGVFVPGLPRPFRVKGGGDLLLSQGGTKQVTVSVTPTRPGRFDRKLTLRTTDPDAARVVLRIRGRAR